MGGEACTTETSFFSEAGPAFGFGQVGLDAGVIRVQERPDPCGFEFGGNEVRQGAEGVPVQSDDTDRSRIRIRIRMSGRRIGVVIGLTVSVGTD